MRAFFLIAGFLVLLLAGTYGVAHAHGLMREDTIASHIRALHDNPATARWAAPAIAGLLAGDLVLPVPSSLVMTLSGALLGAIAGSLVSLVGAMTSALVGFGLCRRWGQRSFSRLIGPRDTERVARLLERYGSWAILLSRSVPMLTEVISCMAGLGRMDARRFTILSLAGTLPVCVVYAVAGAATQQADAAVGWALLVAFILPAAGFGWVRRMHRRQEQKSTPSSPSGTPRS